jgi:hypothetical protein
MFLEIKKENKMNKKYTDVLPNPDVVRMPIVKEMCDGCMKVFENVCKAYIDPSVLAKRGGCALKTNPNIEVSDGKGVTKIKRKFKRAKI